MTSKEISKRMQIGIKAARSAGKILELYFGRIKELKVKNNTPRDIFSKVDLMAEKEIYKTIIKKFKKDSYYGEETGIVKNKGVFKWVVDPLDGTVNYTHGIPIYSVSIALFYKNTCVVGIIYNSKTDEMFYASLNNGAYLNGIKLKISKEVHLKNSLIIAALSSKIKEKGKIYKSFASINESSRGVLRIGSAAMAYTYLISGKIEGIWGYNNKIWDVAAGILLLKEAGGKTSTLKNKKYNYKNFLISSNKLIHNELLLKIS
ncbi:inositol monophosphatase [Candidatus Pelagibacter sp.]|nr:inositol monophosphatase [Candidatus Pelagibacter sp.]